MYQKIALYISLLLASTCKTSDLDVIADLPNTLKEVSGIEITANSDYIWMINDSNNTSDLYGVNTQGKIKKVIDIKAKNHDWEDLTSDDKGNIYIGDFGNNANKRDNLAILIVKADDLNSDQKVEVDRISFSYEDQAKFPPKKKRMFFDCEAFFYYNDHLYLFTKSRVKDEFGLTNLYKLKAKRGHQTAKLMGSFKTCSAHKCWVTAADISNDGTKMVLLTEKAIWLFTDFADDDFFGGSVREIPYEHRSQKESICFISNDEVYVADERAQGEGPNLYKINLD